MKDIFYKAANQIMIETSESTTPKMFMKNDMKHSLSRLKKKSITADVPHTTTPMITKGRAIAETPSEPDCTPTASAVSPIAESAAPSTATIMESIGMILFTAQLYHRKQTVSSDLSV